MYVTMMASSMNLGNNSTIQLEMIDRFGYLKCCQFGFVYTLFVILMFGRIQRWIKNGEEESDFVPQSLMNERD